MLSREQIRDFERWAIESLGIPALVLMENAGRGAAHLLLTLGIPGPVAICCGKGNNGGDGLVIARLLANWKIAVKVYLFANPAELTKEAAAQWQITQRLKIPAEVIEGKPDERLVTEWSRFSWIVDALFGTGLTGSVRPPFDRVIQSINATGVRILAVDIPSGLDADTGETLGATIRAEHTATFVAAKIGFAKPAAAPWLGKIHVIDIGLAEATISQSKVLL